MKPTNEFRNGLVKAAVFENERGAVVTLQISQPLKKECLTKDDWKRHTLNIPERHLLRTIEALQKAYEWTARAANIGQIEAHIEEPANTEVWQLLSELA